MAIKKMTFFSLVSSLGVLGVCFFAFLVILAGFCDNAPGNQSEKWHEH